ncbi:MAG: LacI family DNA-binding transcriptional regulator [Eubacteriales bacterium]|nr:LacI family DNA-binding transcriptional regulator [Eubacteriales bacterium]
MRVKAVDVAKQLNISKATVSLALNNKPGVSPQTREAVYQCIRELEESSEKEEPVSQKQMIKIIMVNKGFKNIVDGEMDLWTDALAVYDRESSRMGYTLGITYITMKPEDIKRTISDVNSQDVAGVVLYATEMDAEEFEAFREIKKPMIVYDNDFTMDYHCVAIDNVAGARNAVDYLVSRGCKRIVYLRNEVDIYNFSQRRAGYRAGLRKNNLDLEKNPIITAGCAVNDVYLNVRNYLESNEMPDAFLMENYQVSIGVMRAIRELRISVPRDLSLVGIDELPRYLLGDFDLTTVKVEHAERARAAMMFLEREIKSDIAGKFKVYSNCELVLGNSVR